MLRSPLLRRCAALGIFLTVIALPIGGVLTWGSALLVSYCHRLYEANSLAREYERDMAEAPARRQAIAAMLRELSTVRAFYGESTNERASASLAQSLREIVQLSGGDLRSVIINPTVRVRGMEKLQVGLDLVLPSSSLPRLLSSLQMMRPFVFLSSLTISSAQYGAADGGLWITINVSAFRKTPHEAT